MTETPTRIVIPLSAAMPMQTPYEARYTHSFTEERVYGQGTSREWTKPLHQQTHFLLRLGKVSCSQHDVNSATSFLRDLVAQKPRVDSFETDVAKPAFKPYEMRQMGVSEHGRRAVYFPETERVTFTLVAPAPQWEAAKSLLTVLALKLPANPSSVVRNLMASAYLTAWKRQLGNRMVTSPPFMDQNGLIDLHVSCLASFDPELAAQFATVDSLPPEGSVLRTVVS